MLSSSQIRQLFFEYFERNGHKVVPSAPLVPFNDPTLLFTNAGMVQFKDVFLGRDERPYKRAVSSQRCVRAGGKHNDLENVGYTARHHTFFEMLGNFSFGDYFKEQAIRYAWEFLTEELKLPEDKLWITVYTDDDEAEAIWLNDIGVDSKRFSRCGEKDNFWSMGETGPCGPCTEIFYDHGEDVPGGPPGSPEEDGDRYIEIWNLVFMQYDRDANGKLTPLPKPSVDTGMGLERLAAVLQHVHSNYDIDLFQALIKRTAAVIGTNDLEANSLKVIADHIRSCAFLIVDGVMPSNEGRGYVLRRIIRRAIRHGHALGMSEPFFYQLVDSLCEQMGEAYPELAERKKLVSDALLREEKQFAKTLDVGMGLLESAIADLDSKLIPGEILFRLYDTYGFPVDLVGDIARERGLELDMDGFEASMAVQKSNAKAASQFQMDTTRIDIDGSSEFTGYQQCQSNTAVEAIYVDGNRVDSIKENDKAVVVLAETPFYAESGGQVGDLGQITSGAGRFVVQDTQKQGDGILHIGFMQTGEMSTSDNVCAEIDAKRRQNIVLNHSATHLLHAALRALLGEEVAQKGSLVAADKLRFDFSFNRPVSKEELLQLETAVNQQIRQNHPVETAIMAPKEAMAAGAVALFGEKYGETVRVLKMGEYSMELCGGTHAKHTGEIGLFKIVTETSVAAGVRRIEALTGEAALAWVNSIEQQVDECVSRLKTNKENLIDKLDALLQAQKAMDKQLNELRAQLAGNAGGALLDQAKDIKGAKVLSASLDGADVPTLRETAEKLRDQLGNAIVLLAGTNGDKANLVVMVSKELTKNCKAGDLIKHVAGQIDGKGGGRPDMAQGGGVNDARLAGALESAYDWVEGCLG